MTDNKRFVLVHAAHKNAVKRYSLDGKWLTKRVIHKAITLKYSRNLGHHIELKQRDISTALRKFAANDKDKEDVHVSGMSSCRHNYYGRRREMFHQYLIPNKTYKNERPLESDIQSWKALLDKQEDYKKNIDQRQPTKMNLRGKRKKIENDNVDECLIDIRNDHNSKVLAERVKSEPVDQWMNKRTIFLFALFPGEHTWDCLEQRTELLSRFLSNKDKEFKNIISNPRPIIDVTGDEYAAVTKDENVLTIEDRNID